MAFEWVAGLFQGDNQQTRGLSGDNAQSVALDDSNPYYNYRLRRHKAEGDIVQDPGLLWYTSPYVKRRTGLGTHVGAEVGDGTANYTDVLLIISREDFAGSTTEWQQSVVRTLQQEFENFCRRENFSRLHSHRPLGVTILEDGSHGMGGQTLGLQRGEFVTGLLPNLYTGPVRGSYPVIGVHVNLPGVWEGYHEVGRLHNDQVLFTLGNHWLDNFSHPSLEQAALYRLRQYPDGSFVHIVNPDLQDRYEVTSTEQGGASVLTLSTRDGVPLAYIVLAVIDPPAIRPARPPARPGIQMPKPPVQPTPRAEDRAVDGVPSIAPPMLMDEDDDGGAASTPGEPSTKRRNLGGKTIIPDTPSERIFTFQERGALLQRVHFSAFMLGYDVYLGSRGELGTHVEDPAATFQVRKRSVALVAHVEGVMVGGRTVPAGLEVPIEGDVRIEVAGQQLEYRDLRHIKVEGWPYVGEIRRPASSTYMIWGEDYQVGRSRECRVVLPDEPRNENIHWKPSVGDGATIRARTGEIPKARFYTDSIMVASEHATIDLRGEVPRAVCTARHCYVYVRRHGEVLPLNPSSSTHDPKSAELLPGDEVLVGNCLFHVGYSPAEGAAAPSPHAPRSAGLLSDHVPDPDLASLDAGEPSVTKQATHPGTPPSMGSSSYRDPSVHFDGSEDATHPGSPPPSRAAGESLYGTPEPAGGTYQREFGGYAASGGGATGGQWDGEDWSEEGDRPASTSFGDLNGVHEHPSEVPKPFPDVTANGLPRPTDPGMYEDEVTSNSVPATGTAEGVVFTDDTAAKFELGRPMHLILAGWSVNGEVVCGNHEGANLIVPENRIVEGQTFRSTDYFRLRIRGRRGELTILDPSEVLVDEETPQLEVYADPGSHVIDIVRRDDRGESDFAVRLRVVEDPSLPDPRARFVALDFDDPLAAALVTIGLPVGTARQLAVAGLEFDLLYENDRVTVLNYLESYRRSSGFYPFFVSQNGGRFKTAPEDGAPFDLVNGDRLVIGNAVYVLREE